MLFKLFYTFAKIGLFTFVGGYGMIAIVQDECVEKKKWITEDEIRKMHLEKVDVNIELEIGDKVEVIDGPLMNMIGQVMTVDAENRRAKVNVEMFGRETPVDLDFSQVRKI